MKNPKLSKLAAAMPFAHYLGLSLARSAPRAAKADEEDEERKQRPDESDEDYAKRMDEMDKEEEQARRAEEQDGDPDAAGDDDDADMEDGAEDDQRDDKEEGKRAGRANGARQRERVRCARIIAAGVKAGRVNQAAVFAFDTSMTSRQAIAALGASDLDQPAARGSRLSSLMSSVQTPIATPQVDAPSASDPRAIAAKAIAAAAKARGEQS